MFYTCARNVNGGICHCWLIVIFLCKQIFSHGTSRCGWFSHAGYGLHPKVKNAEHLCVYICPFVPHSAQCLFFIKKTSNTLCLSAYALCSVGCFLSWLMFNVFIGTDHIATTMTLNFNKKRGCKEFLEWSWHLNHTELENLAKQRISELCLVFTVDARSKPTENRLTRCKTS